MNFSNEERRRYYGLRIGDVVNLKLLDGKVHPNGPAEVIGPYMSDNNSVNLRLNNGIEIKWMAEWCEIVTKIEDRKKTVIEYGGRRQGKLKRYLCSHCKKRNSI
jgi:hypothetical protein